MWYIRVLRDLVHRGRRDPRYLYAAKGLIQTVRNIHTELILNPNISLFCSYVACSVWFCRAMCKMSKRFGYRKIIYGQTLFREIWVYDPFRVDIFILYRDKQSKDIKKSYWPTAIYLLTRGRRHPRYLYAAKGLIQTVRNIHNQHEYAWRFPTSIPSTAQQGGGPLTSSKWPPLCSMQLILTEEHYSLYSNSV